MDVTDVLRAFESGDFARPNLFEVEIPFLGQNFKFKCKAGTMPAATVEKIPVGYMNRKLNIAGDRIYDDWTVTIYNDSAHITRQAIVDWNAMTHGMGNTITGDIPEAYKKPGVVRQKDRNGESTKEYAIIGLFPTNVGEVTLDWDDNNTVSTFEVTFALDWWE
ncbi:gp19 [Aeromonas phage 31]|uniref:Tail tube protein n=4 Tax=Biquartavirus TaxID=1912143 RepID=Q6U9E7_9CAUD|nr:gp19 [Aeromonas phage 44RR2.8t]YP_238882.1 tail tube protein [Aeromonas phage 31]APU00627.1 tail fibers [Aeromonas phage 44RR2.8t.2]APU01047.1 tail fibers [Aeromonas phage 31.2]APU01957.1 tail fibers [Aeromonas phage L9-6]APU02209.1 tail fibers [Aeromonas phage Riv-10]APU02455.1 tail fibers [Aeromonas phage SW69-9]UYD59710.1 tail tube protein [Aeromonas phage avDM5]UYD60560.1 tail tube protein [Aeromonas phage avDM2]